MNPAVSISCLIFSFFAVVATGQGSAGVAWGAGKAPSGAISAKSNKGTFNLVMTVRGNELRKGTNSLDINIKDKAGKSVIGAKVTVTPWMPSPGLGVWEKPVITERSGGNYHVDNVSIIKSGTWELKVSVKRGDVEDLALFSFNVEERSQESKSETDRSRPSYFRSVENYNVPDVTLLNQDGKRINFRSMIDSGKPVIIDFIYTTCTTICPVLSAGFVNVRKALGPDASKVQLISISIDPDNDRPPQMKAYLAKFNAGDGWDFLTGSRSDITRVLKSLDAYIVDKMNHEPVYILHGPHSDDWIRIKGVIRKADLLKELRGVQSK